VDRIRSLGNQILQQKQDYFTTDFEKNKEALARLMIIRSKQLRNRLAGSITAEMKRRSAEKQVTLTNTEKNPTE